MKQRKYFQILAGFLILLLSVIADQSLGLFDEWVQLIGLVMVCSFCGFVLVLALRYLDFHWAYSPTITLAGLLLPVITAVVTKAITGNLAMSLGLVGALSIIRFRNPVRSPLELIFYFGAITLGIAGTVNLKLSILLSALFSGIVVVYAFMKDSGIARSFLFGAPAGRDIDQYNPLHYIYVDTPSSLENLPDHCIKQQLLADGQFSYVLGFTDAAVAKEMFDRLCADNGCSQLRLEIA